MTRVPIVTEYPPNVARNDWTGQVGFRFVPTRRLLVTHLGRPATSFGFTHVLRLWDESTQQLVAQGTLVRTATQSFHDWPVVELDEPVILRPGTGYRITSSEEAGGDYWQDHIDMTGSFTSDITDVRRTWTIGTGYPATQGTEEGHAYVWPTMLHLVNHKLGDEVGFWCPSIDHDKAGSTGLTDFSTNGNHGAFDNGLDSSAWVDDTGAGGLRALSINGNGRNVMVGDVPALSFEQTDPWTISFWIHTTSTGTQAFVSKMNGTTPYRGFDVLLIGGQQIRTHIIHVYSGKSIVMDHYLGFSLLNDWHHLLYQWDGSGVVDGMRVWVDGTYVSNRSSDVNNPFVETIQNDVPFRIGVRDPSASGMNGRIDDIRVFARELKATERSLLASQRAPEIKRPVPPSWLHMPMMGA